jgi:hypothetical protein
MSDTPSQGLDRVCAIVVVNSGFGLQRRAETPGGVGRGSDRRSLSVRLGNDAILKFSVLLWAVSLAIE